MPVKKPLRPARSTQRRSTASKPAPRKAVGKTTPAPRKRTTPRRSRPLFSIGKISAERRLDILGIVLALVGLLTLLSLLSSERSEVTGWWVTLQMQIAGWGAVILPLAAIVFGLWLVFRNVERLPMLSLERLAGIILLFLNILTAMHFFAGGGWEKAQAGIGGGYLGAVFQLLLEGGLGKAGTVIILVAWFLIGWVMILDLSVSDIYHFIAGKMEAEKRAVSRKPARHKVEEPVEKVEEGLPPGFQPLAEREPPISGRAHLGSTTKTPGIPRSGDVAPKDRSPQYPAEAGRQEPPSLWKLPDPAMILDPVTPAAIQASSEKEQAKIIEETLASFGTPVHVVDIQRGPTITQFGVEPDFIETRTGRTRVRVSRIVSLADDLALALAAPRIRIQAPVPGRNYVGIEVPNVEISRVALREVLESEAFKKIKSPLKFTLGKDVSGKPMAYDLAEMPHLLIAGTTGSGKSVCVNAILSCFLMNNTPEDMRLVLVDPKRVELTGYNRIPHLLAPVVVDIEKVIGALQWMLREMDNRYHKFAAAGVRNIHEFNNKHKGEKLPYLLVVIDELADLMLLSPDETERNITRLAQLARATGIHLILATQRPSVDVVTGLIKANFPARIAFAVASGVDSRVILDQPGAERLLGRGDMLFQAPDASAPVRLQGVYVSEHETQRLVDYWRTAWEGLKAQSTGEVSRADFELPRGVPLKQVPLWEEVEEQNEDPLVSEAIDLVRREGRASITMLQRRMRIGYTRAARLIDTLEEKGIIGPAESNSQVREVLDYGPTIPPEDDGY